MISAEARGKLRVWRRQAAYTAALVAAAFESDAAGGVFADYRHKSGKGRDRALRRLRHLFEPAARWAGPPPRWAYIGLKAPGTTYDSDEPSLAQGCVSIGLIMIDDARLVRVPLWTIEVSDHALARYFERDRGGDLTSAIWAAHAVAHALDGAALLKRGARRCLLPAGPGAFGAEIMGGESDDGVRFVYLRCTTWLHADMLTDHQERAEFAPVAKLGLGDIVLEKRHAA